MPATLKCISVCNSHTYQYNWISRLFTFTQKWCCHPPPIDAVCVYFAIIKHFKWAQSPSLKISSFLTDILKFIRSCCCGPATQHPYMWDIAYNNAGLFFACMSCSYENVSFHCKSRLCGRAVVTCTCSFLPWLLVIFIATGLRVCKFANLETFIVNLLQTLIYVNLRLRPPSTYLVGTTKNADCLILTTT